MDTTALAAVLFFLGSLIVGIFAGVALVDFCIRSIRNR